MFIFQLLKPPPPPNPKKGIGVVTPPACTDLRELDAAWYSKWSPWPDSSSCTPEELAKFVPRIRDAEDMQDLNQAIEIAKASGWLIGFTEPNLPWQGNISPAQGAIYWRQIEVAANAAGVKLVSPSPNQYSPGEADPYGHQWTWEMVKEYKKRYGTNPHFDAFGWNIYKRSPDDIKSYLNARHNEALDRGYTVPIWVLEYGGECWNSSTGKTGNTAVMTEVTSWFNKTSWIERYAWFANRLTSANKGWQSCSLINVSTGNLSDLGKIYRGY